MNFLFFIPPPPLLFFTLIIIILWSILLSWLSNDFRSLLSWMSKQCWPQSHEEEETKTAECRISCLIKKKKKRLLVHKHPIWSYLVLLNTNVHTKQKAIDCQTGSVTLTATKDSFIFGQSSWSHDSVGSTILQGQSVHEPSMTPKHCDW